MPAFSRVPSPLETVSSLLLREFYTASLSVDKLQGFSRTAPGMVFRSLLSYLLQVLHEV